MNEYTRDIVIGFWFVVALGIVSMVAIKGCSKVYDPEVIKADAEARVKSAEFRAAHPGVSF